MSEAGLVVRRGVADTAGEFSRAAPAARIQTVDVLRGFDMFWIVGGDALVRSLAHVSQAPWAQFLVGQLHHAQWGGPYTFYDLVLPLFIFVSGVSIVFAIPRALEHDGLGGTIRKIFFRAFFLWCLGLVYYDGVKRGYDGIRLLGVLQRIALCYFFAALAFCVLSTRTIVILIAAILLGYWGLLEFVTFPGAWANPYAKEANGSIH